jgi:hypothetical protein
MNLLGAQTRTDGDDVMETAVMKKTRFEAKKPRTQVIPRRNDKIPHPFSLIGEPNPKTFSFAQDWRRSSKK